MSQSDKVSPSTRLTAIVVETSSVKHKNPHQEQEEPISDQHQRLSKAPAVPQELKNIEEAAVLDDDEKKDLKPVLPWLHTPVKSDKLKHRDTATSHSKHRAQSPEKIAMAALDSTKHKIPLAQPIPPIADSRPAPLPDQGQDKDGLEPASTYSMLPVEPEAEVTVTDTQGAWSDDEEAGGMPREAHGSRVARAFRKLLCLGSDDTDDCDIKPTKQELDESPRTQDSGI